MIVYWTLTAAGVTGFLACLANLCHAADRTDPEPKANRVPFFWAATYFGGTFLMAQAWVSGIWAAASPSPLLVWLTCCAAGHAMTRAVRLHVARQRVERARRRGPEALGLWERHRNRAACALIVTLGTLAMFRGPMGCAPVDPTLSAIQKDLVISERSLKAGFESVDALLVFDDENRAYLRQKFPRVHEFAEYLREPGPDGVSRLQHATEAAWDAHALALRQPTADNVAGFDVMAQQVASWAAQARKYLAETR